MGLLDNFTDTAATLLTAHTSDSSHTWAKCTGYTDNMQIAASGTRVRATTLATFPLHYSSWTPPADQYASINIYEPDVGNVGQVGLYLRADNTAIGTTSYGLAIYTDGVPITTKRKIDLYRGGTLLTSWTDTVNLSTYLPTTVTVYAEARTNGSQVDLVVKHQGTTVISYSDTSGSRITSAGRIAFYTFDPSAPAESTAAPIDSLSAGGIPGAVASRRRPRGLYVR